MFRAPQPRLNCTPEHRADLFGSIAMRTAAIATFVAAVFAVAAASAQQPPSLAPPMPYKAVPVKPPQPVNDATFNAFRQQLAGIAQKKDRTALAAIIAKN